MRKLLLILPIAGLAFFPACGGGGDSNEAAAPAASTQPAAPAFDPATAGAVQGVVTLEGTAPEMTNIQMAADPNCARMHSGEVSNEFVIAGEGGTLANAFVYVKSGITGNFSPPSEPVVLDQKGCMYVPHVIGLQVGQTLEVVNSDETLHNIHATPSNNKEFNIGQPIQGLRTEKVFDNVEIMVPFKCDVHKWMNSYAGVLDHPYFAITDADGSFSIPDLPPGEYVIEAWHERLGTQEASITVGEQETIEHSFSFTATE